MTTIQYASDLHLEFADNWRYLKQHPLKICGDILILAGDIGYLSDENYSDHPFWDWVSENYNQVYCCMGNHEFYKHFDVATLRNGYCMRIRPSAVIPTSYGTLLLLSPHHETSKKPLAGPKTVCFRYTYGTENLRRRKLYQRPRKNPAMTRQRPLRNHCKSADYV